MLAHIDHSLRLGAKDGPLFEPMKIKRPLTEQSQLLQLLEHKLTIVEEVTHASAGRNIILRGLIALQMQTYLARPSTWWDSMSGKSVNGWVAMAVEDLRKATSSIPETQGSEPAEGYSVQLTRAFQ